MKVAKIPLNVKQFKDDPIGFITDKLVAFIVNLLIPIPLAGDIVAQFKRPIMGMLISLFIIALMMVTVIGTIFMSPLLVGSSIIQSITSLFENTSNIAIDPSFGDVSVPRRNPFGGDGMSYTTITAYFMDPAYYMQFGRNHTGIDLVPTSNYYANSQTYKATHQVIIFSTISGTVNTYVDEYGGETVEVVNNIGTFKTKYIHFSSMLVANGATIKAGTPIGIMGETGMATGEHTHYEVHIKDGDNWRAENPLDYIQ